MATSVKKTTNPSTVTAKGGTPNSKKGISPAIVKLSWAEEFNYIVTGNTKKIDWFELNLSQKERIKTVRALKAKQELEKVKKDGNDSFKEKLSVTELRKLFNYSKLNDVERSEVKKSLLENVGYLSTESVVALGLTLASEDKSKLTKDDWEFRNEILNLLTKSFNEATKNVLIEDVREFCWRPNLESAVFYKETSGDKQNKKSKEGNEVLPKIALAGAPATAPVKANLVPTKDENGIWINKLAHLELINYFSKKELFLKSLMAQAPELNNKIDNWSVQESSTSISDADIKDVQREKKEISTSAFKKHFEEKIFKSSKFSKNAFVFLETVGALSTDKELILRTKQALSHCRTLSNYKFKNDYARKKVNAAKFLIYCIERSIDIKELMIGKKNPIDIVLTHQENAGFENINLKAFLEKVYNAGWLNGYSGTHPVYALTELFCKGNWLERDMSGKETLEFLDSIGFRVDGSAPADCKVSKGAQALLPMVCKRAPFLMSAAGGTKKQSGVMFFQTFLDLCIGSGVDLNKPNASGLSALRYLNMGIKKPYYGVEVRQVLEQAFEKLVGAGARLETLLPQKDIKQIAGSPYVKRLIEAHMEKLELIASLDQKYLDKAVEIVKKMKDEDEKRLQENSVNKKTMRL